MFVGECSKQGEILSAMVAAGSYDGCSGKSELSIDGMKFVDEHTLVTKQLIRVVEESVGNK